MTNVLPFVKETTNSSRARYRRLGSSGTFVACSCHSEAPLRRRQPTDEENRLLKQITYFNKRPDLSAAAFTGHWRTRHAEIVCELPGLRRYVQNHVAGPDPALDGVAEVWFDDIEAMRANVGQPALDRIRADERNFIDLDTMGSIIAVPETVIDGEAGATKLIVLVKRNPAVEPERFHRVWRDDVGGAVAAQSDDPNAPTRYEQDHTRASAYRDGREPPYDGTASLWFANPGAANAFFASPGFATVAAVERDLMHPSAIRALWADPLLIR